MILNIEYYIEIEEKCVFIANITLRRGGIWILAQTPQKHFKTH